MKLARMKLAGAMLVGLTLWVIGFYYSDLLFLIGLVVFAVSAGISIGRR